MNKERLAKVADIIEENPENFDMKWWIAFYHEPSEYSDVPVWDADSTVKAVQTHGTECGTTMCIAGWACHLWGADSEEPYVDDAAREILGLSESEARELFDGMQGNEHALHLLREWSK